MSTQPSTKNGPQPYLLDFERPINVIEQELLRLEAAAADGGSDFSAIEKKRAELNEALRQVYGKLTAWDHVLVSRHPRRPLLRDYLRLITEDFYELHGDKVYGDDRAMVCGFARIAGACDDYHYGKGCTYTREDRGHLGRAHPRDTGRLSRKCSWRRFKVPIVCLIDTPAYPGIAENGARTRSP